MLVFTDSILSTAVRMTRYQYLKEKGFNGSNEGIPEKLKEVNSYLEYSIEVPSVEIKFKLKYESTRTASKLVLNLDLS